MSLELITEKMISACKAANIQVIQPLLQANSLAFQDKDNYGRNFVTQADLETELFLKAELSNIGSEANFIAEETAELAKPEGLNWIVDPIDGTTNFMHGLSPACTSIALANNEELLCGVVFELFREECFHAWQHGGAYLNGKKICVSRNSSLTSSLLVTGFPYIQNELFDNWIELYGTEKRKTLEGLEPQLMTCAPILSVDLMRITNTISTLGMLPLEH